MITLTRKELYDLLWSEPMSVMIKKYNISYAEIRKTCLGMNIPIPENGHWSRIQFGKSVTIQELPESCSGKTEITLTIRDSRLESQRGLKKSMDDSDDKSSKSLFKVPERLVNPDILISNTKDYFDAVKKHDWRTDTSYPTRNDVLDIDTTYSTIPRALRIMDTLIKILRDRGHDIQFKYGKTNTVISGQEIEIKLREKYRVVDEPRGKYDSRNLEPTGILSFIIDYGHYHQKTINDGQDLLETKLETIITKLETLGELKREEHIKNEEWHRQYQEKLRIEKEIKEKKEKELSDFRLIFQRAFRLHHSNIIRGYISSVEKRAKATGELTDELRTWMNWAKEKVDWYDPLVNRNDDTLDDYDKTNVFKEFLKEWI